jgi:hypothetical protein
VVEIVYLVPVFVDLFCFTATTATPLWCCLAAATFPFSLSYIVATMATKQYSETDLSGKGSDPEQASPHISSAAGSDVDDNYNLYKQHEGEAPADSAEAKSVLRKIDWRVMPVLWTLYLLQYLDKNGLNYVCFYCLPFLRDQAHGWISDLTKYRTINC